MLGYTRDIRLSRINYNAVLEDAVINFETPNKDASYLRLFMTIEPQLSVPEQLIQTVISFF
jgi:hypothetical protein